MGGTSWLVDLLWGRYLTSFSVLKFLHHYYFCFEKRSHGSIVSRLMGV